jgi:hypothetical protein
LFLNTRNYGWSHSWITYKIPRVCRKGGEDVEQHWYLCEVVWRAHQNPDATKLIEFQTTLRDRALRWFIKWIDANPNAGIDQVKQEFIQEFKLPQSNQQGLAELLDIHQREGESSWKCMQ